eukprot:11200474-Lingulodinium_polyedra.AAC.1
MHLLKIKRRTLLRPTMCNFWSAYRPRGRASAVVVGVAFRMAHCKRSRLAFCKLCVSTTHDLHEHPARSTFYAR